MLELVEQYPDTNQLAAACACSSDGVVYVADEIWAALPLEETTDADILLIEREIIGLCARDASDAQGWRWHGSLEAATRAVHDSGAATQAYTSLAKPSARGRCEAAQGRGVPHAAPRLAPAAARAAPVPSAAVRPTTASTCADFPDTPASGRCQWRVRSASRRPRPRRARYRSASRGRRRRSRSIPLARRRSHDDRHLTRVPHRTSEARAALTLLPRARSPYIRSH